MPGQSTTPEESKPDQVAIQLAKQLLSYDETQMRAIQAFLENVLSYRDYLSNGMEANEVLFSQVVPLVKRDGTLQIREFPSAVIK